MNGLQVWAPRWEELLGQHGAVGNSELVELTELRLPCPDQAAFPGHCTWPGASRLALRTVRSGTKQQAELRGQGRKGGRDCHQRLLGKGRPIPAAAGRLQGGL